MKHLLLCLLLPSLIIAQQKPLSIGDTVPAGILSSITTNDKLKTANTFLILDFFATYCMACIKELPKLDSLQQRFQAKLQIIIVATESSQKLQAFQKKNKLFANCQLPIVAGDTLLKKFFPHKYLPHQVWISPHGVVSAITGPYYTNAANIQSWVNGNQPGLPLKEDALDFDAKKPLLQNDNGGNESLLLFRSMLTRRLKGMGASEGFVKKDSMIRWYHINNTILILYQKAFGFAFNRIILEVTDPSRYILPASLSEEWQDANFYSYEITAPAHWPKAILDSFMRQDLDRSLRLHGRIEKRLMNCWLLQHNNANEAALKTRSVMQAIKTDQQTGNFIFRNQPMSEVVSAFNAANSPAPGKPIILDETGIKINIDMDIPGAALDDFALLKTALEQYGFSLVPAQRKIEMFILSEPKTINIALHGK